MESVKTAEKRVLQDEKGRFLPGNNANPTGLPKGLKHELIEVKRAFIEAFQKTGGMAGLIEWVEHDRRNRKLFYQMILQVLPKDINLEGEGLGDTHIHISPEKVLIFKDIKNAENGRTDNPDAGKGSESNRVAGQV